MGDGLSEDEQSKALEGTIFIPFSQFPPKKMRKDCFYNNTPSMLAPKHLENIDSCEVGWSFMLSFSSFGNITSHYAQQRNPVTV